MRALRKLRRLRRRIRNRGRPVILMYHRVADIAHDPWHLAVRPDLFEEQIEALVRMRRVVPLRWLASRLAERRVPRNLAAVTFDDGYLDVLIHGLPALERHGCPATVFLTTGAVEGAQEFWWDELTRVVLESPTLPEELELEIAGRAHRWRPEDLSREAFHRELWNLLRPLGTGARRDALAAVSTWARSGSPDGSASRALDPTEVRGLIASGLVEIGAHTVTHPSLPLLDRQERRAEIEESRRACAELSGTEIDAFAYPYGDLDDATVRDVGDAGFAIACSTEEAVVTSQSNPLRLPRIGVGNWSAEELLSRITQVGLK